MRVALIGNMNNNFFGLVRYLRDRGYEAELLYPDDMEHFLPPCDTYTLDYQAYCRQLDWNQQTFYTTSVEEICTVLDGYDVVVACGYAAAFVSKAGRTVDVYIPYGSDLYKYTHIDQRFTLRSRLLRMLRKAVGRGGQPLDMSHGTVHRHLRKGIRQARHLIFARTNEDVEAKLASLQIEGKRWEFSIPFLYAPEYDPQTIERFATRSHWYEEFRKLREAYDVVVFHHSRHIWCTHANAFSFKGNDKLIRGFAAFLKQRPEVSACLVTMDYGLDVEASKALIEELGIGDHVKWFPKMYRKDIMMGLHLCDIATGEFDKSYLIFGSIMEAMAMGKPLLHYREDALYEDLYPALYPLMNAREADAIAAALCGYADDPAAHRAMGNASREWFLQYVVEEPLHHMDEMLAPAARPNDPARRAVNASS